jgi:hypothetical protein
MDLQMSKTKTSAASAIASSDGVAKLLEQYGCGSIPFTGTDHALYERHLTFDHVVRLADATGDYAVRCLQSPPEAKFLGKQRPG